jgi:hypothetical protein
MLRVYKKKFYLMVLFPLAFFGNWHIPVYASKQGSPWKFISQAVEAYNVVTC